MTRHALLALVLLLVLAVGARPVAPIDLQPGDSAHCLGDAVLVTGQLDVNCVLFTPTPTRAPTAAFTPTPTATHAPTATDTATPTPQPTSTATVLPTTTATPSTQAVFPIRAAFYYPWFPNAWTQLGIYPYSNFQPSLGYYDSQSDTVIDAQVSAAQSAHLDAFISSWWGPGHQTDLALSHMISRTLSASLRWSVYYEAEGQGDPSAAQIASDLAYLAPTFAKPNYLKVNGAPVVFVYGDASDGCAMATRWQQARAQFGQPVYIVLKVFAGYAACANQPDSWHQYSPAVGYDAQLPYSAAISPGFWKVGESVRLARDVTRFAADAAKMVATKANWQLVTTWNEWGEGTGVESTQQFARDYLDALCRAIPGTLTCPVVVPPPVTATATPSVTPSATPLPTSIPASDPVIAAAGDIACDSGVATGSSTCRDLFTSDLLFNQGLAAVLPLGDTQYESGALASFQSEYAATWGRVLGITHPAVGNHEYGTSGGSGYFAYFGARAGDPAKGYYSYDIGSWHLIALNSECSHAGGCGTGSPQEVWLRADLAAHPTACTLAYWHEPRFSSGQHGNNSAYAAFWNALYAAHAEIVLNGHDHDYERFGKQSPAAVADANGIRAFVVGTGGKSHYGFSAPVANSQVRDSATYGVLKLTLHAAAYDWKFVPEAGQSFSDSGSDTCR